MKHAALISTFFFAALSFTLSAEAAKNPMYRYYGDVTNCHSTVIAGSYAWQLTDAGVVRWNLNDGKLEVLSSRNSPLCDDFPSCLSLDRNGCLWFGYSDGQFTRVQDGKWTSWSIFELVPELVDEYDTGVEQICVDRYNNVWLLVAETLVSFQEGVAKIHKIGEADSHDELRCITLDNEGNLWAGPVQGGLLKIDGDKWTCYGEELFVRGLYPEALFVDYKDRLWITNDIPSRGGWTPQEVLMFDGTEAYLLCFADDDWSYDILDVYVDGNDRLWLKVLDIDYEIGDYDQTIILATDKLDFSDYPALNAYYNDLWEDSILPEPALEYSLECDSSEPEAFLYQQLVMQLKGSARINELWPILQSYLNQYGWGDVETETAPYSRLHFISVTNAGVWGVKDGDYEIGSYYIPVKFKTIGENGLTGIELHDVFDSPVTNALTDSKGRLYVSFENAGLATRHTDGKWTYNNTETSGIPSDSVYDMALGSEGSIWILTDKGLARFQNGGWYSFKNNDSFEYNDDLRKIAIDAWNRVWTLSDKGLVCFDGKRWKIYPLDQVSEENEMRGFAIGDDFTIWLMTEKGLYSLKDGLWSAHGIYPNQDEYIDLNTILTDPQNRVWMLLRDAGLVCYDGKAWTVYGLLTDPYYFYNRAMTLDPKGNLWISSSGGLIEFNPDGVKD